MGNTAVKSMYVHIPFCTKICSYCDFCKNYHNESIVKKYLIALKKEIENTYDNDLLDTLYVGGGTPSCLSMNELEELFKILSIVKLNDVYEFTFECNYEDINEELLSYLKNKRVNRLSIGIQTFNDKYAKFLNRNINKEDMIDKINLSKKYFDNINVDIMYAVPNQNMDDIKNDLSIIKKLDINHVSTYALIKEDNTVLAINNIKEVDDDIQSDMYYEIKMYLESIGYNHYEISNYAKSGFESRHNLTYWNNENYYGVGTGASSFLKNIRKDNTRSINNYINGSFAINEEIVDNDQMIKDEVMLNLRLLKGINKERFYKKYNKKVEDFFDYKTLVEEGLVNETKENINIDKDYLFVSNSIISRFIDTYKY